jgi:hypothetical protein
MSTAFPISEERCASERYSQRVTPEWVRHDYVKLLPDADF